MTHEQFDVVLPAAVRPVPAPRRSSRRPATACCCSRRSAFHDMIRNWYGILEKKDKANNLFTRSQKIPLLRERLIVLLSGGYDKVDLEAILKAAHESEHAGRAN